MCLLAFLTQFSGVVPEAFALLAMLDGSHEVGIHSGNGTVELVLRHERAPVTPSARKVEHQHGGLARVICLFAEPNRNDPDHVVQFAGSVPSEASRELEVKPVLGAPLNDRDADAELQPPQLLPSSSVARLPGLRPLSASLDPLGLRTISLLI